MPLREFLTVIQEAEYDGVHDHGVVGEKAGGDQVDTEDEHSDQVKPDELCL